MNRAITKESQVSTKTWLVEKKNWFPTTKFLLNITYQKMTENRISSPTFIIQQKITSSCCSSSLESQALNKKNNSNCQPCFHGHSRPSCTSKSSMAASNKESTTLDVAQSTCLTGRHRKGAGVSSVQKIRKFKGSMTFCLESWNEFFFDFRSQLNARRLQHHTEVNIPKSELDHPLSKGHLL